MCYLPAWGLWAAAILLTSILAWSPAQAQNALCPSMIPNQGGILFTGSSCTGDKGSGAYSNAALASQSLGELSESSTEQATIAALASISERRSTEQQKCPDGYTRFAGECVPAAASRYAADPPDAIAATMPPSLRAMTASLNTAAEQPPAPDPPHWAVWTQGYGDYMRQSGQSLGTAMDFTSTALSANSSTWTGGILGGADYTLRNVASAGDGLIVGLLIGFEFSDVSLKTSSVTPAQENRPNGNATYNAHLSGPATGVYASYFNNRGFSTDLAFKAEFYALNLAFTDLLGFQGVPGFLMTPYQHSDSGSTSLNDYTFTGNVNYRILTSAATWVEPTAGFEYTISQYAAGAYQFGLADGSLVRLQGGARFGFESAWNGLRVSTVATGLLYHDVLVSGGVLPSAPNPKILADQGLLRAEGILTLNFDHGNGVTSFVQADVEGGKGLFGAGGKVGVRIAW